MAESIDKKTVPLGAFFASDSLDPNPEWDAQRRLDAAEVILGADVMSQREFLVYGSKVPEQIALSGETKNLNLLKIGIDQATGDLEKLIALVSVSKGRHDYIARGETEARQLNLIPKAEEEGKGK